MTPRNSKRGVIALIIIVSFFVLNVYLWGIGIWTVIGWYSQAMRRGV